MTGASRSIGAAVARRLAADGADVAINFLGSPDRASEVAEAVRAAGRRAIAVRADVGVESEVRRLVAEVEAEFGRIDILVNNAVYAPKVAFGDIDTATWLRSFDVNVHGPFWCIKAVVPIMRRHGGGRIVNVGSGAANGAQNGVGPHYAATKAALHALTRNVAHELAPENIIVNGVMPGFTMTDLMRTLRTPEQIEAVGRTIALGRLATPEETADVVSYLCSDRASYFVGQMYPMSAG
ncbi:MAG TPA: SDR family oxidoreductase [Chloroflexota bacterium]